MFNVAVIFRVLRMYYWQDMRWCSGISSCSDGYRSFIVFTWSSARNHLCTIIEWMDLWLMCWELQSVLCWLLQL